MQVKKKGQMPTNPADESTIHH